MPTNVDLMDTGVVSDLPDVDEDDVCPSAWLKDAYKTQKICSNLKTLHLSQFQH